MKTKITKLLISIVSIYIGTTQITAQTDTLKKIKVESIEYLVGIIPFPNNPISTSDVQQLIPESAVPNLTEYHQNYNDYTNGSSIMSASFNFKLLNKSTNTYRKNVIARLGVSFLSVQDLYASWNKVNGNNILDTLVSSQTGQTYFLDSVSENDIHLDYSSSQLRIDGSLIIRTNPNENVYFYTGIGATIGASVSAKTHVSSSSIYERKLDSTQVNYTNDYHIYPSEINYYSINSWSSYSNKSNISGSVYLPIGIDVQLLKYDKKGHRFHFFYEMRVGMNMTAIPELKTYWSPYLQQSGGLRFMLN